MSGFPDIGTSHPKTVCRSQTHPFGPSNLLLPFYHSADSDNLIKHTESLKISEIQRLHFFPKAGNCQAHSGSLWKTNTTGSAVNIFLTKSSKLLYQGRKYSSADPHSHATKWLPYEMMLMSPGICGQHCRVRHQNMCQQQKPKVCMLRDSGTE